MKIVNKTIYRTDHLKAILQKAAEVELEPAKRKVLHVTVSYTRGGHSSGCAYVKGRHAWVRIRHPYSRDARYIHVYDSDPRPAHGRWSKADGTTGKVVKDDSPRVLTPTDRDELVLHFAHVAGHEFAHVRGMEHRAMPAYYRWTGNWREYVKWAKGMPLEVKVPKTVKPTVDVKLDHVRKMLKLATSRAKRANTLLRKWKTREKYYLNRMAASRTDSSSRKDK